ncbi:MAG: response regulator transcription factor [Clostridia bacterium]|nr:response regulator transcription factor [Clostridia bacterium]
MEPIKVLIADDQELIRNALVNILNSSHDIQVLGACKNGLEVCDQTDQLRPDIILMDVRMPIMDGLEATQKICSKHPGIAIIVLTTFEEDEYIFKSMSYGARGFLLKDITSEDLITTIKKAYKNEVILPSSIAARIARLAADYQPREGALKPLAFQLTDRQIEVAQLLVQGLSNGEIARKLCITEGTVKNYISEIYYKINVNNRSKAVMKLKGMVAR